MKAELLKGLSTEELAAELIKRTKSDRTDKELAAKEAKVKKDAEQLKIQHKEKVEFSKYVEVLKKKKLYEIVIPARILVYTDDPETARKDAVEFCYEVSMDYAGSGGDFRAAIKKCKTIREIDLDQSDGKEVLAVGSYKNWKGSLTQCSLENLWDFAIRGKLKHYLKTTLKDQK